MATKKNPALTVADTAYIVEGLRKLALQRDTKVKHSEDEDEQEQYQQDIANLRQLLTKLGDTKPLVLKSERKAKAKPKAKVNTLNELFDKTFAI
jgi:hypothetical protein